METRNRGQTERYFGTLRAESDPTTLSANIMLFFMIIGGRLARWELLDASFVAGFIHELLLPVLTNIQMLIVISDSAECLLVDCVNVN